MVSKIAVMAMVALVAIPIGLGYALNIQTVDYTHFTEENKSVNVSDLLRSGNQYEYVSADTVALNSKNLLYGTIQTNTVPLMPFYNRGTSAYSTVSASQSIILSADVPTSPGSLIDVPKNTYWFQLRVYTESGNYGGFAIRINDVTANTVLADITNVLYLYYSADTEIITVWSSDGGPGGQITSIDVSSAGTVYLYYYKAGAFVGQIYKSYSHRPPYPSPGIDLTAGFSIKPTAFQTFVKPPAYAKSVLLTIDLDSTNQPDTAGEIMHIYPYHVGVTSADIRPYLQLKKSVNDSIWTLELLTTDHPGTPISSIELPKFATGKNVYQFEIKEKGANVFYIGGWPDRFGYANVYNTYHFDYDNPTTNIDLQSVGINYSSFLGSGFILTNGLTVRVDNAEVRSTTTAIIEDTVLTPTNFKASNPVTTLSNVSTVGTSIDFGGNTYQVSKGNLVIGTKQFSVQGIQFDSVPSEETPGQYDNRINGNVVSTSAAPSTIGFNGKWLCSVTIDNQTIKTGQETKWIPGAWAWDGIGTSFAMVGLLACLGVFIGLGMYGRRSGAKVGSLMLICAGGALIFLAIM